ncbi:hypothetical protein G647_05568 [Cladophialophora carrionii CBS 160.54]|uniref:Uncharacterized protein n=1 Tax=Cladophialophora carrionii CBS 160.54 TaxID=1279043 RepID=V9DCR9_9EURO|nr:uncharacterized protein G647_05568 [Cladophialophora carrionii CBS 160.54]ETI23762.1 hypothetical protein G647_05568 [Cladophialophora carrionii CBS 160.54]
MEIELFRESAALRRGAAASEAFRPCIAVACRRLPRQGCIHMKRRARTISRTFL